MCYAQCHLHYAFCTYLFAEYYCFFALYYGLYTMRFALFNIHYALCALHYSIFTMHDALYTMHFAICISHFSLCTLRFAFALYNTWTHPRRHVLHVLRLLGVLGHPGVANLLQSSSLRWLFLFCFLDRSMACKLHSRLQYKSHVRIGFDLSIGNMNQEWEPYFLQFRLYWYQPDEKSINARLNNECKTETLIPSSVIIYKKGQLACHYIDIFCQSKYSLCFLLRKMHAGILISESDILIPESRKAQSGEPHTSYLSILAHHHNIEACKSTPKSAQTRDKIA